MNLDQLRKIIKSTVKEAVREELKAILTEAVLGASRLDEEYSESRANTGDLMRDIKKTAKIKNEYDQEYEGNPIADIIEETRRSMTTTDYSNMINTTSGQVTPFSTVLPPNLANKHTVEDIRPGELNIADLPFMKKAQAIHKRTVELEKEKYK